MSQGQKLELTWMGKDHEDVLEPRILIEQPELNYGDYPTSLDPKESGNLLIHGDNLLALKALIAAGYGGQVKCIYIDPPYNTGSAFEHYDDNLEHSIWLSLMRQRLKLLRELLSEDGGSLWISIDDNECHYLKVMCDEIFGRANFVSNLIWQKKTAPQGHAQWFSDNHDHILVYARAKETWHPFLLPRTEEQNARYSRTDDPRGVYAPDNFTISLTGGARGAQYARTGVSENVYEITLPSGRRVLPPKGRCWLVKEDRYKELLQDNLIVFAKGGDGVPMIKRFLKDVRQGTVPLTILLHSDVGGNTEAKKEVREFNQQEIFSTPKPERLIERVLTLATKPGDLVLDSFLGSGTTSAVAHKMGRRWIGIELGDHAYTHCARRMQLVVDGTDQGGISRAQGWKGGGGYRFYELAPPLILTDDLGIPVINEQYDAERLAAAMALHQGYVYQPDKEVYWRQGYNQSKGFIYTTTQHITADLLNHIAAGLAGGETLLICCSSHDRGLESLHPQISLLRIPQRLLGTCTFKEPRAGYDLNIICPPAFEDEEDELTEEEDELTEESSPAESVQALGASDLFSNEGE